MQSHREGILRDIRLHGGTYTPVDYMMYESRNYPHDLSAIYGIWREPLGFTFKNLVVLDMEIREALYWLFPILHATGQHLRRIILRQLQQLEGLAFPFPFTQLDHYLYDRYEVKVIILFPDEGEMTMMQEKLPLLHYLTRLEHINAEGMYNPLLLYIEFLINFADCRCTAQSCRSWRGFGRRLWVCL